MNIAVCDDEKIIREQIKNIIKKQKPDYFVYTYISGNELILDKRDFDIVFLDIQMKGINGIDTAKKLKEKKEEIIIIFITGIKEYVFDAFDVSAFHYLLKPIDENKFLEIFENAIKKINKQQQNGNHIFIKTRNRNIILNKNNILYIESRSKKVEIHTTNEIIEIYSSMNYFEQKLGDSFYRCHRGYLVNMSYISEYVVDTIKLNNGENIYLAKERYNEFVKTYMRYLRNGNIIL